MPSKTVKTKQHQKDNRKLAEAAREGDTVVFFYKKLESDPEIYELRTVRVEHIREADSSGKVYLHGYDLLRGGYRNFRLEQIQPGSIKVAR